MNSSFPGTYVGHLVIASFGMVFVGVNSGSLNPGLRLTAIVLAAAAFLAVVVAFVRTLRNWNDVALGIAATRFNKTFGVVVAIEAVALFGGARIINEVEPSAILGWIALVVGLHFIALAIWWMPGQIGFMSDGVALTLLGITGLVIGFIAHETDAVALLSGVGSRIVLVGTSLIAAVRTLLYRRHPTDIPATPR